LLEDGGIFAGNWRDHLILAASRASVTFSVTRSPTTAGRNLRQRDGKAFAGAFEAAGIVTLPSARLKKCPQMRRNFQC